MPEINLNEFIEFCKYHKMENIAFLMLLKTNAKLIYPQEMNGLKRAYQTSIMVQATQQHYLDMVTKTFEEEGIDYLLLKGRDLAMLYPSEDMRQSSDFDIYIGAENAKKAKPLMMNMGFEIVSYEEERDWHDEYLAKKWVMCELHKVLIQGDYPWRKGCNEMVNNLTLKEGSNHCYKMCKEDFYVYNLAHAAKHMKLSGIGIKVFVDIELIYTLYKDSFDYEYLNKRLEKCNLKEFDKNVRKLCEYWFEDATPEDDIVYEMEKYVAQSGWIGTKEQAVSTELAQNYGKTQSKTLAKIKKCFKIIFCPYEEMAIKYPVLKKHKYLTPIFRIRRAFSAVLKRRDVIRSVSATLDSGDISEGRKILEFKKSIGL